MSFARLSAAGRISCRVSRRSLTDRIARTSPDSMHGDLVSEVFADAVDQATGTKTHYNNMSAEGRAIDLPHENFGSYFLDTFDRPRRVSSCECERSSGATFAQVLLLSNSDDIENKLADGNGRVAQLIKQSKPTHEVIEELFLATYSRFPTNDEFEKTVAYVDSLPQDKRQAHRRRTLDVVEF